MTCKKIVFFSKINPLNEPVLRSSELLLRALLYVNENDTLVVGEIWVVGKKTREMGPRRGSLSWGGGGGGEGGTDQAVPWVAILE